MTGIFVFILRLLLAGALYAFLGWSIYTIWQDLRIHSTLLGSKQVPIIKVETLNKDERTILELGLPEIIIGRDPNCEFSIPDETISARHAKLGFRQKQWWVEDLQSTNGTFLNEEEVKTPTVIISGDELRCGQVKMRIQIEPPHS